MDSGSELAVEVFEYAEIPGPPMPSFEAFPSIAGLSRFDSHESTGATEQATKEAASEARGKELQRSFEAGLVRGHQEGRAAERQAMAGAIEAEQRRMVEQTCALAEQFNAERAKYTKAVEREVVKLALAIAARILRKEAQMDPLVLSGAVRVALGQLSGSTEARLRVPASDLDLWKETIAHLPNLRVKPGVIPGEGMRSGECALETGLGSADLSLGSQLAEIERVLFDGSVVGREHKHTINEEMTE